MSKNIKIKSKKSFVNNGGDSDVDLDNNISDNDNDIDNDIDNNIDNDDNNNSDTELDNNSDYDNEDDYDSENNIDDENYDDNENENDDDNEDENDDKEDNNDTLDNITNDNNNNIVIRKKIVENKDRITNNFMSKFEFTRILGIRATQIERGSIILLKNANELKKKYSAEQLAILELQNKSCPLFLIRELPNGNIEKWDVNELIIRKEYLRIDDINN